MAGWSPWPPSRTASYSRRDSPPINDSTSGTDRSRRSRSSEYGIPSPVVRLSIFEGPDAPWTGEGYPDQVGLVLEDGREFWCGDDLGGVVLVEAAAGELELLAASEIALEWLA